MDTIDVNAIITVAKNVGQLSAQKPEVQTIDGRQCLVGVNGLIAVLEVPEGRLPNPKRKRAQVTLYEALSFIAYVKAHKVARQTHLFGEASETEASFTAIIDYHDTQGPLAIAAKDGATTETAATPIPAALAHWGEHVVTLNLEITPEWARWVQNSGKLMPQEAFAEFVDENLADIILPDPAEILEMAQGLQGRRDVAFKSGRNLKTGAIDLQYSEAITVNGTTNRRDDSFQVPDKFTLGLVPFIGANGVQIEARLRFRIGQDGKLFFAYVLTRPYKVIETAFLAAREDIEQAVGLPVHLGEAQITR